MYLLKATVALLRFLQSTTDELLPSIYRRTRVTAPLLRLHGVTMFRDMRDVGELHALYARTQPATAFVTASGDWSLPATNDIIGFVAARRVR
jgi:hypothetical protein